MRVLVVGAGGQLGGDLTSRLAAAGHDVVAVGRAQCDLTDTAALRSLVASERWDFVVNCAAYTAVDRAETDEALARAVNEVAPGVIAAVCSQSGARLIQISTDFVFDGSATTPIPETAPTHPLSIYGATKAAGEEAVRAAGENHLIVRTSWLFGRTGPNFVLTMLRLARRHDRLRVVADQTGTPTWSGDLADALVLLLATDARGTMHLTNSGSTTWHGLASAAVELAGVSVPIEAITTAEYPTPAARPRYSVMANDTWARLGFRPLPEWRDGLASYIAELTATTGAPPPAGAPSTPGSLGNA